MTGLLENDEFKEPIQIEGEWTFNSSMTFELFIDADGGYFKRSIFNEQAMVKKVNKNFYDIFKRDIGGQCDEHNRRYDKTFLGELESL